MQSPRAKRVPFTSIHHGHVRTDDYAWLSNRDDPEVRAHLEAENKYTDHVMVPHKALEEKLFQEMKGRIKETDCSAPIKVDQYYYYTRTEEGKQYPIECRKKGSMDAAEEIILDINELAKGHVFFDLGALEVSPDHEKLAYSVDLNGSERFTVYIKDLLSGKLLKDRVEKTHTSLEWANDSTTLFYTTFDHAARPDKAWRHILGTSSKDDVLVYHEKDERFFVFLSKSRTKKFIHIELKSRVTREERLIDADHPSHEPTLFEPRTQEHEYYVEHHNTCFFVMTNQGAKNFKLVQTPLDHTSSKHWRDVIAHRENVALEGVDVFKDFLAIHELHDGIIKLRIRSLSDGEEHYITMLESAYGVRGYGNPDFNAQYFTFTYSSLITPPSVWRYDVATRDRELLKETPIAGYDRNLYVVRRCMARSHDGVGIPLTLVYRKDLRKDGSNPLWLSGYGSYGTVNTPLFRNSIISLLDRGFVYALVHVRGGGDKGRAWYEEGKYLKKKNTFLDFITAAEFLITNGYTSRHTLVASGDSAGGLLIGAVLNMRPDLFRVAVTAVPCVDILNTMLDPSIPLTITEYEEWGNPNVKEYYNYIHSYAPYENVSAQGYPALLVIAGFCDRRVQYFEAAKWVAKLRSLKTDNHTLLLRTYMTQGHEGASGRYDYLRELAFEYAFVLSEIGIKE